MKSLRGHKRNPFQNETGFFIKANVKSALLKGCDMKKRVICGAKDGFYAWNELKLRTRASVTLVCLINLVYSNTFAQAMERKNIIIIIES